LAVVVLGATALRGGSAPRIQAAVAVTPPKHALAPDGPPIPTLMAGGPNGLELDVPVAQGRVTAIVYHGVGDAHTIALAPAGHQKNAGILTKLSNLLTGTSTGAGPAYYVDSAGGGPETGSVDIGAVAGTRVYSPVDGTIVGIRPYVLDGSPHGSILQIQPTSTPADIVTLTNIRTTSQIAVGDQVIAARSRLGTVIDLSRVITQELAKYTSDAGNHVHLEVGPAPAASLLL
jgi:hypothetical protein